jgi:cell division transport system permease protein
VEGYARAVALVRGLTTLIGVVLGVAALLIVAGTIRLAVHARREEIGILRLVGASRSFVAAPFLIEGLLQGLAGGVLALGLLYGLFRLARPALRSGLELLLGYATPGFLEPGGCVALVLAGALLGLLGSVAALAGGSEP